MERIARVVPIKSKELLLKICNEFRSKTPKEKRPLFEPFGKGSERWYYQEIEGRPFLISVTESEKLTEGLAQYPETQDPFFVWFNSAIEQLTGTSLRENPTGATSELVLEMTSDEIQ